VGRKEEKKPDEIRYPRRRKKKFLADAEGGEERFRASGVSQGWSAGVAGRVKNGGPPPPGEGGQIIIHGQKQGRKKKHNRYVPFYGEVLFGYFLFRGGGWVFLSTCCEGGPRPQKKNVRGQKPPPRAPALQNFCGGGVGAVHVRHNHQKGTKKKVGQKREERRGVRAALVLGSPHPPLLQKKGPPPHPCDLARVNHQRHIQ